MAARNYEPVIERVYTTERGSRISMKHVPSCCRVSKGKVICMNKQCPITSCGFR